MKTNERNQMIHHHHFVMNAGGIDGDCRCGAHLSKTGEVIESVTEQRYADELVRLVRADWDAGQIEGIGSWQGLHFVCDANEYLIEACESFGMDLDGSDEQNGFLNHAVALAEKALGWESAYAEAAAEI